MQMSSMKENERILLDNSLGCSQLPARATRLLNRSRLQQSQLSNAGSDSPRSGDSLPRKSSRASSLHLNNRDTNSSSDDLLLHDKSFRNSMIQDVLYFKRQLIRLRRILQETETLNPFDLSNGQYFASCGLDSCHQSSDGKDLGSLTSSTTEDHMQELADLRRQVVYLQGQVDDRDRTIRLQKNFIEKLEAEKQTVSVSTSISEKECINTATQTERVRPLSIGQDGLASVIQRYAVQKYRHFMNFLLKLKQTTQTIFSNFNNRVHVRRTIERATQIVRNEYEAVENRYSENLNYIGTLLSEHLNDFLQNSFNLISRSYHYTIRSAYEYNSRHQITLSCLLPTTNRLVSSNFFSYFYFLQNLMP